MSTCIFGFNPGFYWLLKVDLFTLTEFYVCKLMYINKIEKCMDAFLSLYFQLFPRYQQSIHFVYFTNARKVENHHKTCRNFNL